MLGGTLGFDEAEAYKEETQKTKSKNHNGKKELDQSSLYRLGDYLLSRYLYLPVLRVCLGHLLFCVKSEGLQNS